MMKLLVVLVFVCCCIPLGSSKDVFTHHVSSTAQVEGTIQGSLARLKQANGNLVTLKAPSGSKKFSAVFKFKTDTDSFPISGVTARVKFTSNKHNTWTWRAKKDSTTWTKLTPTNVQKENGYATFDLKFSKAHISNSGLVQIKINGKDGETAKMDQMKIKISYCPIKPSTLPNKYASCPFTKLSVNPNDFTYKLKQSTSKYKIWTSPVTDKIKSNSKVPSNAQSGIEIYAAKNEFEPFQIAIKTSANGKIPISMGKFSGLGNGQRVELFKQEYDSGVAEELNPIGSKLQLENNRVTAVWVNVYVPKSAKKGKYSSTLKIDGVKIPVKLNVHNFQIPEKINFATQMNIGMGSIAGNEEKSKKTLLEHRWTPKSVPWPSSFHYDITWENSKNPKKCKEIWDEPDECPNYCIKDLSQKYVLGKKWSGVSQGFPNFMLFQFVDNNTPRPSSFCGTSRGSGHIGGSTYNTKWKKYLSKLQSYLVNKDLIKKAYYYVQNEPQNQDDYDVAAFLCKTTKSAAPKIRIAISEEPKKQIAEHDEYGPCGYDIWIAHLVAYGENYAWKRQRDYGEEVWFYSLPQDAAPYFNPTVVKNSGTHVRVIPWAAWTHRITGYAYYNAGLWFHDGRPGVRAELFREGFEDYEYFYKANGNSHPEVFKNAKLDYSIQSVVQSMTSWSKDHSLYAAMRIALGKLIASGSKDFPIAFLKGSSSENAKPIYINFQDKDGEPSQDPLTVNSKKYIKVGWEYSDGIDSKAGYGFTVDAGSPRKTHWDQWSSSFNDLERSSIFDDYGRSFTFEIKLPNGEYDITIGIGRPTGTGDLANVVVEGETFIDDYNHSTGQKVYSKKGRFQVKDGLLSCVFGGKDNNGNWAYTFLSYMKIVPV